MRRRPLYAEVVFFSAAGGVPLLGGSGLGGDAGKLSPRASLPVAPRYPPGRTGSLLTQIPPSARAASPPGGVLLHPFRSGGRESPLSYTPPAPRGGGSRSGILHPMGRRAGKTTPR